MQDNTLLVVLGVVGLALVCGGLVLFVAMVLFRATGHRLLGFFSLLARDADDRGSDAAPSFAKPSTPNLRAIAEAQDFDTALARHIVQDEIEPQAARHMTPPPANTPAEALSGFDVPPTPKLGARRSTRPELQRNDDEDDMFGALLDDEQIP